MKELSHKDFFEKLLKVFGVKMQILKVITLKCDLQKGPNCKWSKVKG